MMSRNNVSRPNEISLEIKRQIGQQANARYLRTLFPTDNELPASFDGLLQELDRAEHRRKQPKRS